MKSKAAVMTMVFVLSSVLAAVSCSKPEQESRQASAKSGTGSTVGTSGTATTAAENHTQPNPDREAYFGETHVHTSWSLDAYVFRNHIAGPADAPYYAQGQTIKHPLGYDIKIDTPLDWMGVTDHSEYVGVSSEANTPGSAISKLPAAQPMIIRDPNNKEEVQK